MIACLKGILLQRGEGKVIIMAGGVGYEVYLTGKCITELPELDGEVMVYVYTHVREDALVLYGFSTLAEKEIFEILIGVSGIGPKLALAILSGLEPAEISNALATDDTSCLTKVPGVGKRTAERMCLELKDKVSFIPNSEIASTSGLSKSSLQSDIGKDVVSTLINLGYSRAGSEEAVRKLVKARNNKESLSFEDLLKMALKEVSLV